MSDSNDKDAVDLIKASLGQNASSTEDSINFEIIDIWNVSGGLTSPKNTKPQNYYFVGSRGSGKSSLITRALQLINQENKKSKTQTLPAVLSSSGFLAIGEDIHEQSIKNFIELLFEEILEQMKTRKPYEKISRWSSVYASIKERSEFGRLEKVLGDLTENKEQNLTAEKEENTYSSSRLRLMADIANINFSLLQAGNINIGNISFKPIKLTFEKEQEQNIIVTEDEKATIQNKLNERTGILDNDISKILSEVASVCERESINTIIIYIDDLHFVPVLLQLQIIHTLRRITGELQKYDITFAYKIFSATNLSPYIREILGLSSKDLQIQNIESSLDGLEQKRRAIENLLTSLLKGKLGWSENKYGTLFRREITELILVLAGGHPRKFLETCAKVIDLSQGRADRNLHNIIMLSAAEVIHDYRNNLAIQLGIDNDPNAIAYREMYSQSIGELAQKFEKMQSPYFIVPLKELRNHPELEQWISDALIIGDLLEVTKLNWNKREAYKMLAINPATLYDKLGRTVFPVKYRDIVDLQIGAEKIDTEYTP